MRILLCNYEYPPLGGGGGVICALLAEELAARHEVTVLTSRAADGPTETVEGGVRVVRVPVLMRRSAAVASFASMFSYIPRGVQRGRALLRAGSFDVINTHFALPTGPVGDALSSFSEVPNVLTLHGGDLFDPSKFTSPHRHLPLRVWIRRLLRRADAVVGQSSNTLENVRRFYDPDFEGIKIPLGIRRPSRKSASRAQYGFADDEVLLVSVGRLVARKAVSQLLESMAGWRGRPVRLLIIGTGPLEERLEAESAERGLSSQVTFMGQVAEAAKFEVLRMCDVYVSTSQHEGFGLVFLEAMSCGLPIVCYDLGGQRDFLQDGETGFMVRLNDLRMFQERCGLLIDDRALRLKMGERNERRVEDFYIDSCAARYEAAFHDVVEAHRGTRRVTVRSAESLR